MGLFEQHKILFNKYRKFQALNDEIVNFGVSSHDDCVDALVWLCNGLMSRGKLELEYWRIRLLRVSNMVANFFYKGIELEQDAYGSAIFNLPDEVCHDLGLQPGERFDIEADDENIIFKRQAAGYEIDA